MKKPFSHMMNKATLNFTEQGTMSIFWAPILSKSCCRLICFWLHFAKKAIPNLICTLSLSSHHILSFSLFIIFSSNAQPHIMASPRRRIFVTFSDFVLFFLRIFYMRHTFIALSPVLLSSCTFCRDFYMLQLLFHICYYYYMACSLWSYTVPCCVASAD